MELQLSSKTKDRSMNSPRQFQYKNLIYAIIKYPPRNREIFVEASYNKYINFNTPMNSFLDERYQVTQKQS